MKRSTQVRFAYGAPIRARREARAELTRPRFASGSESVRIALISLALLFVATSQSSAQILRTPEGTLHFIYPAGGRQGQTVPVEISSLQGLEGAKDLLIEGPPGISVRDFKAISGSRVQASLVIAADAVPGPRQIRVRGGANGLTGSRPFYVSSMSEMVEKEPNNEPGSATEVKLPVVINGRLDPVLDVDCFAFEAKAGQRIIAGVLAHGMDSRMRGKGANGFVDASLELLDAQGKVLASAEDTVGLDPVIEHVIPADGRFFVRIQALGFEGSPAAVYRLTLGALPYPVAAFPSGGQRGTTTNVGFVGFQVDAAAAKITLPTSGFPFHFIGQRQVLNDGREMPFILGEHPTVVEREPNDDVQRAELLNLRFPSDKDTSSQSLGISGRFDKPGDVDCYRVSLKKGQGVVAEITAQRHLRSPVDSHLEILDAAGKVLAENDDGVMFAGQCEHDFPSSDSRLEFTAPQDGDYIVRVSDQNGTNGPLAIYHLTVEPLTPDFRLFQWPDAVPIWGPGTTASFVVQVQRWGGLTGDIQLRIEGLPKGWKGSVGSLGAANYVGPRHGLNQKALLTITTPADANVGDAVPFRVVGKVEQNGKIIERTANPQTLLGSSHTDRMHLRCSNQAWAAVAPPQDCWLETSVTELTVTVGSTVEIPVKVHRKPDLKTPISISVDGETVAASSAWRTPLTLKAVENDLQLPLQVKERRPGTYGIVVSRGWAADLRAGRPGPCAPLILLHVKEAAKK